MEGVRMKKNRILTVVLTLMMALWMTMGSAYGADTCEGYENKENVPSSGSGTFDVVNSDGEIIGSITWNNDAEPENVSWSVDDGYSLNVCVKGGDALATGSGQSGTVTPPEKNDGTPDVSHFAWTVVVVGATDEETEDTDVIEKETEQEKDVVEKETEDDKNDTDERDDTNERDNTDVVERDTDDDSDDDVEVAVADTDATAQVGQVPAGAANTGGGSTSGVENAQLFVLGLVLIAAAGSVLVFARRAGRSA